MNEWGKAALPLDMMVLLVGWGFFLPVALGLPADCKLDLTSALQSQVGAEGGSSFGRVEAGSLPL